MNKTILIAGKDAPASAAFSAEALRCGRNALITVPTELANQEGNSIGEKLPWNRSSPMSARSLIIQGENKFGAIDEALLIFDTEHFTPRFTVMDAACFTRAADEMILGYFYAVSELTARFKEKKKGKIIFLLKMGSPENTKVPAPVAAARGAFSALGENIAEKSLETGNNTQVLLVRSEDDTDQSIASWLFPYADNNVKKRSALWVKPGSRSGGIFPFLR